MVVFHDELELELGEVKIRTGTSVKGHNGLKSVSKSMGGPPGWWRVGVGIGRPDSREKGDVSNYVLREMRGAERLKIRGDEAVGAVLQGLETIDKKGEV